MKNLRIWILIAFGVLCLPCTVFAQTVNGWSDIWYDEASQTVVADGITSLFGFSCCSPTTHMPYVEVQLDGPSGSAFDSYEGAWWEDAETSVWLDAAPGAFTVVSAHGVDVMGPDILMFSEVGYQSYLSDSGDFGSGGSDPDTLEWPGMVMLGDTRDSFTLLRVTINSADITQDSIRVSLEPAALSGLLSIAVQYGPSGANQFYVLTNATRASGSHTESFNAPSIPRNEYTVIQAEWNVNSIPAATVTQYSYHFKALGTYSNTLYGTPTESYCTGGLIERTYDVGVPPDPCTFADNVSRNHRFKTDFDGLVWNNGSGVSSVAPVLGFISREWQYSERFRTVPDSCPFCRNGLTAGTSVAVSPTNRDLACRDVVFVYTQGTRVVADHGGRLSDTQLDHYQGAIACSRDIGNAGPLPVFRLY